MSQLARIRSWGILLVVSVGWPAVAQNNKKDAPPKAVQGKVTEVTLYRGQARVVRSIELDGAHGPVELVVTDLPSQVVPQSLFAESVEGIDVRAVRYRKRAVGKAPRAEVRALEEKIAGLRDLIEANQDRQTLAAKRLAYLDKLEGFVAPTAKTELSKGVLDAEALEKVTQFSFAQREKVMQQLLELKKQSRQLKEDLSVAEHERRALAGGFSRLVHEAVLFLEKRAAGKQPVRLTYLVNQCGWAPSYNFRAKSGEGQVRLEYNGVIQQMSGEDWTNVKLTLSTASPSISAAVPGLASMPVSLNQGSSAQTSLASSPQLQKKIQSFNKLRMQAYQ
ncbi:MAG: mucoidy inhibitor MuiA family protein, partial [Phycisphaeraceae bacterium]|nr:mucoidy inhibitor MuiA family protein [Phycisphaeraceae bacterium]